MRVLHLDTFARLSAKGARGLGDLCYAWTEVERRTHEMQAFLRELRKPKKCQRTVAAPLPFLYNNSIIPMTHRKELPWGNV